MRLDRQSQRELIRQHWKHFIINQVNSMFMVSTKSGEKFNHHMFYVLSGIKSRTLNRKHVTVSIFVLFSSFLSVNFFMTSESWLEKLNFSNQIQYGCQTQTHTDGGLCPIISHVQPL
ncbi:hypothetical protein AMECASPLE_033788 [Ameca splendens]|uniref:Uncharacterized protein n=1 Tax=Ameca splendens TaxID=208324 RepID=A0ABV0Y6T1_9TELE